MSLECADPLLECVYLQSTLCFCLFQAQIEGYSLQIMSPKDLLMQSTLSLKRLLACGGQARMPQLNPHHHSLENSEVISQIPFFGAFFWSFFNFSFAPLESRDRGLLVVEFNKAMAAGTSKCGLCRVSWFSFIPNCSPHM